jgi:hypothetical protein
LGVPVGEIALPGRGRPGGGCALGVDQGLDSGDSLPQPGQLVDDRRLELGAGVERVLDLPRECGRQVMPPSDRLGESFQVAPQ